MCFFLILSTSLCFFLLLQCFSAERVFSLSFAHIDFSLFTSIGNQKDEKLNSVSSVKPNMRLQFSCLLMFFPGSGQQRLRNTVSSFLYTALPAVSLGKCTICTEYFSCGDPLKMICSTTSYVAFVK